MSIFDFFRKASQARIVSSVSKVGQPVVSPANYESFAKKGYSSNAIAFSCVHKIALAAAGIDLYVYEKKKNGKRGQKLEAHPLMQLLERPNPMQSRASFIESLVGFYSIAGNTYIESVQTSPNAPVLELWVIRPDKMSIIPNAQGYPGAYVYKDGGAYRKWDVDFVKLQSQILHIKTFNPLDIWYGMSPMQAALLGLDQNNAASRWNLALLQNSATPSGVLTTKATDSNPTGMLTEDQYTRLRDEFMQAQAGSRNAGRPLILEGGLVWTQTAFTMRDMEFAKGKDMSAQDIAMVYGVPLEILGLGQKTFTNFAEARQAFYEETILPILDIVIGELNRWLAPSFGDNIEIGYDENDIEALAPKRAQKYASMNAVSYLTVNEKREITGHEKLPGWDVIVMGTDLVSDPEEYSATPELPPPSNDPAKPQDEGDEKPEENEDSNDDDEDEPDLDDAKSLDFKAINLLNANEKRKSWRKQTRIKRAIEKRFARDIEEELKDINARIAQKVASNVNVYESAIAHAVDDEMKDLARVIRKHIRYTMDVFGDVIIGEAKTMGLTKLERKANRKYNDYVERYVETRTATAVTEIAGTTRKKARATIKRIIGESMEQGLNTEEIASELRSDLNGLTPSRSRTIAKTEVGMAASNGSLEAVKSLSVPNLEKEWVSSASSDPRDGEKGGPDHQVMNGARVPLDEKFGVPPDALMDGPGDPSAGADQVINCGCVLVYKQKTDLT